MPALQEGEEVVKIVRRHWWVVLSESLFVSVLAVVPIFFYEVASIFLARFNYVVENQAALFLFFYFLWLLILWMVFFLVWTNYYLDIWVITNRRMIDIEQKGLFHREISTLRLDRIQDVTVEVKGILGTFFKFGNIIVQTAGEHKAFIIRDASHPEGVKETIMNEYNRALDKSGLISK